MMEALCRTVCYQKSDLMGGESLARNTKNAHGVQGGRKWETLVIRWEYVIITGRVYRC